MAEEVATACTTQPATRHAPTTTVTPLPTRGRSTSPEMGISPSTEARANGGPTRNPYGLGHSAGGSSGGAAAALASGMVSIAHANDGAGSIRIPASCCGLIGLKPSRGLVPAGPLFGEGWGGLAVEHMLTTSTRDSAAALLASAGADAGAPHAAPGSLLGLMDALHRADAAPRLRIALCDTTFDGDPVHPEVARAVRHLAARLEALGHAVEPGRPPIGTLESRLCQRNPQYWSGEQLTLYLE